MVLAKKVAVIGAGICGLLNIKCLKDEGFEPVCFEKSGNAGGLWRYHEDDVDGLASVMKNTIINTSKELGAVSLVPPPAECPNYMHQTLMYDYIFSTAKQLDCLRHIRYHHETKLIEKAYDYETTGRWKVTNLNTETGEQIIEEFDCVLVCIGHHAYPNEPTFPGQEKFRGKIMHSHALKKADGFEDQKVVVVGVGNSGMDASVELSNVAKKVYLSSRRGTWVIGRIGKHGYPMDLEYARRYIRFLCSILPYSLICTVGESNANRNFDHSLYGLKPKHRILSQHPTVSDLLPIKLLSGVVLVRGNIERFTEKGVVFDGEEEETEVDTVILATGYKIKFPFLSDDIVKVVDNKVQLYKFIFPPHLPHTTLAILGLVQPTAPGIPVGEMQGRWVARIMAGRHKLPSKEEMWKDIREKEDKIRKTFVDSPRHTLQVDFIGYQDELAEEIGVKPNLLKLAFTDFRLFWALLFGPSLPYQYRLQGPHSWNGAREAILTYKERVIKPFMRPGQSSLSLNEPLLTTSRIFIFAFLLPILYLLYILLFG